MKSKRGFLLLAFTISIILLCDFIGIPVSANQDAEPGLNIIAAPMPDGDAKSVYPVQTLTAENGQGPYKWSIKKGTVLPSGLQLKADKTDTSVATISGKPARSSNADGYAFTVQVTDSLKAIAYKDFTLHINKAITLTASKLPPTEVGIPFPAWSPEASGGDGCFTFECDLPSGLDLDASTGAISGVPQEDGTFPVTLTVKDTSGGSTYKKLSLKVLKPLSITTPELPDGIAGTAYKSTTLTAAGGAGKKTWTAQDKLPSGLALTPQGVIKGVPALASAGVYPVNIQVSDGVGKVTKGFEILISDPFLVTPLPEGVPGVPYYHILTATGGNGECKITSVSSLPRWLKYDSQTSLISGIPPKTGNYSFKVKVSDSLKNTVTQTVTVPICTDNTPGIIAFVSYRDDPHPEIYIMNADGSNQTKLTDNAINDWAPSISPDGEKIAFVSDRDGPAQIFIMNVDGTNPQNLSNNSCVEIHPSWSPDGSKIAFSSNQDGTPSDIYFMNSDGSNRTRLTVDGGDKPAWSGDSKKIAFVSRRDNTDDTRVYNIYVINIDGTGETRITDEDPGYIYGIAWSAANGKIVYDSITPYNPVPGVPDYNSRGLFIINSDGSGRTALPTEGALQNASMPAWSPDGLRIAFSTTRTPPIEIYTVKADGSNLTQLTGNFVDDTDPSWSIGCWLAPAVTTQPATDITCNSATLNGTLTDMGAASSVQVSFKWGTTDEDLTGGTDTLTLTEPGPFSIPITGLYHAQGYYFAAEATSLGSVSGDVHHFMTSLVTVYKATEIGPTSAKLSGHMSGKGNEFVSTTISFEYGLTTAYGSETTPIIKKQITGFNTVVTGLTPDSTYHFRAKSIAKDIHYDYGTMYSNDLTFTTLPKEPIVAHNGASPRSTTEVQLSGWLHSLGIASSVEVSFEWGETLDYGNTTRPRVYTEPYSFSDIVTGLTPGGIYHFRVKGVGVGTSYSNDCPFTMPMPTALTLNPASDITSNSATLSGSLENMGLANSVAIYFNYGRTPFYGSAAFPIIMYSPGPFSVNISGLMPETLYYFRIWGSGSESIVENNNQTFTTGANTPTIVYTSPATDVTEVAAVLNAELAPLDEASTMEVSFEWGETTNYGKITEAQEIASLGAVSANLIDLTPGKAYHFRAIAQGGVHGIVTGADAVFITIPIAQAGKIAFSSNRDSISGDTAYADIYLMNADASNKKRLTFNSAGNSEPVISADSSRIAYNHYNNIYIMDIDGSNIIKLTNTPTISQSYRNPAWSPDGAKIAFCGNDNGDNFSKIFVINTDGSGQKHLTTGNDADEHPSWSPDGTKIVFTRHPGWGGASQLCIMDSDGTNQTQITESWNDTEPVWSPDGSRIAFVYGGYINTINLDGGNRTPLAPGVSPCWSPDGAKIAFMSYDECSTQIMDEDGTNRIKLTADAHHPSWVDN